MDTSGVPTVAVVGEASLTQGCGHLVCVQVPRPSGKRPEPGSQDPAAGQILGFGGDSILFSTVAAPLLKFSPTAHKLNVSTTAFKTPERPLSILESTDAKWKTGEPAECRL